MKFGWQWPSSSAEEIKMWQVYNDNEEDRQRTNFYKKKKGQLESLA